MLNAASCVADDSGRGVVAYRFEHVRSPQPAWLQREGRETVDFQALETPNSMWRGH